MSTTVDLAVVGAGITGLAAAWEGMRSGAGVSVLKGAGRAGGKLATSPLGGLPVDEAADAFLARVPDAVALCEELGIGGELVAPATGSAFVWSEGALRRLPTEQLLGVPTDLDAVAATGILSPAGLERARADLTAPGDHPPGDESVGALIRRRLGDEVLDRLVAPLIGGVWAGDCDELSLQTVAPTLAAARDHGPSLIRSAAAARAEALAAAAAAGDRPVFLAPRGGMGRLVEALTEALGDRIRYGAPVRAISRDGARWRLEPAGVTAGAVVVTVPAGAASALLSDAAPEAAAFLTGVRYASVTLVGLAVPRAGIDHELDGSGFLVPQSAGLLLTACSWASSKWAHLAGDRSMALLRASAGRAGDERAATMPDDALVEALLADLRTTMGLRARPAEVRINRFPGAFPQPRPGHLDAVAALEAALARSAPGLAVAGAWARGLGIPACIRAGRQVAAAVLRSPAADRSGAAPSGRAATPPASQGNATA